MKKLIYTILFSISFTACGQATLEELLDNYNNETVPYISVEQLQVKESQLLLLDTRTLEEFQVSHLKNAHWVGFEKFEIEKFRNLFPEKDIEIVVYCSLGVRSERIGEQLQNDGYTAVYNLFGGIFEWKNSLLPVYDLGGNETQKVHVHSKRWSPWLKKGEKVY
jgi:rhodanese-related sulfurtransferase